MNSVTAYLRHQWRTILTVITLVALVGVTYAIRHQIFETFRNLDNVNYWFLILVLVLQLGYYHFHAHMYRSLFKLLGHRVSYRQLFRATLELTFVNHVFPSGGITGFSYWGLMMRRRNVTGAQATLVQTMRFVLIFISFQVLLFLALIILAFDGKVNNFLLLVSGSMATLLVLGTLFLLYIIDNKSRINNFFTFLTVAVNKLIHLIKPNSPETIKVERAKQLFQDYHENYKILKRNYKQLASPFLNSFFINVAEVLTVYAVFLAFGEWINLGAVIIAYAVANFAGLISVIPGGIGIYEGLMVAVLVTGGVPAALSLPVIVMYRVLTIFLQIPVGGLLYYRTIHAKDG